MLSFFSASPRRNSKGLYANLHIEILPAVKGAQTCMAAGYSLVDYNFKFNSYTYLKILTYGMLLRQKIFLLAHFLPSSDTPKEQIQS
jgi:hypothetical protein